MPGWLLRGVALGIVHAIASVALAKVAVWHPTEASILTWLVIAVLVGIAAGWGAVDGWLRRPARGRDWVIAALLAGPVSGVLDVAGRGLLVDGTGFSALGDALIGGAAFVALLVLLPAALGLLVGGKLDSPAGEASSGEAPGGEASSGEVATGGTRAQAPRTNGRE